MQRFVMAMVATSTGFSGAAIVAAVTQHGFMSTLMAVGSVCATALGWLIARRIELEHLHIQIQAEERAAVRDQARLDAEAKRTEQIAELVQQMKLQAIRDRKQE